jgi:hypothetical protein
LEALRQHRLADAVIHAGPQAGLTVFGKGVGGHGENRDRRAVRPALLDRLDALGIQFHREDGNRLRSLAEGRHIAGIKKLAHDPKCFVGNPWAAEVDRVGIKTMTGARANNRGSIQQATELAEACPLLSAANPT